MESIKVGLLGLGVVGGGTWKVLARNAKVMEPPPEVSQVVDPSGRRTTVGGGAPPAAGPIDA